MGRWIGLLAVGVALAVAPPAASATGGPYSTWAEGSLVPVPEPMPPVVGEPCPGSGGRHLSACWLDGTIYLARTVATDRVLFLHELGHAFDMQHMTDAYRTGWRKIARWPQPTPWFGEMGETSPGEQFADAYSLCARRPRVSKAVAENGPIGAGYGWAPTPSQHRRACALIRRAAR